MTNMDDKKWYSINKELLPIKAHYFFLFGGMAGTVTFMPIIAKGLGFHATAVGIIFTLLPFCIFFSKFFFGYLTDLFRNIKLIMMILAVVTTATFMLVLLIPSLNTDPKYKTQIKVLCKNGSSMLTIKTLQANPCINKSLPANCNLTTKNCFYEPELETLKGIVEKDKSEDMPNTKAEYETYQLLFYSKEHISNRKRCDCMEAQLSILSCSFNVSTCPSHEVDKYSSVYISYKFWLFLILTIISGSGSAASFCLNDAACYEVLDQQTNLYGRQRLWATVSWGLVTLLAGFLNDIATGSSEKTDYSPGFYIMLVFMAIDLTILYRIHLVKATTSVRICKDFGTIFMSYETIVFAVAVYICGAMTGLIWNYEFWYLQDLGASQTLLGLVIAVQCLVTEVPFFFFSGWLITKFRHFYCIVGVFIAFALRLGLYVSLKDPWLVLPVELLHGITFALCYATMTNYAADFAPPGTEVTTLGVLEGLFEGLGVATGSLLGGIGFDQLGGRKTFFVASMISLICVPIFAFAYIIHMKVSNEGRFEQIKPLNEKRKYGTDEVWELNETK